MVARCDSVSSSYVGRGNTSLYFTCAHMVPDDKITNIYQNAILRQAHLDMKAPPASQCSHDKVMGGCGNHREELTECRCEALDRIKKHKIRQNFEDQVISAVEKIPFKQGLSIKIAIFASGGLLGEEILLFRLFDRLEQLKRTSGRIDLFFIDRSYQEAVEKHQLSPSMAQFEREISQVAPKSLTVTATFFGDAKDYMRKAKEDPSSFTHDLLVGEDIEDGNVVMGKIHKEAGKELEPIVLLKTATMDQGEVPKVCRLDRQGNTKNCYDPLKRTPSSFGGKSSEADSENNSVLVICGVLVALVVFGILYFSFNPSKQTGKKSCAI